MVSHAFQWHYLEGINCYRGGNFSFFLSSTFFSWVNSYSKFDRNRLSSTIFLYELLIVCLSLAFVLKALCSFCRISWTFLFNADILLRNTDDSPFFSAATCFCGSCLLALPLCKSEFFKLLSNLCEHSAVFLSCFCFYYPLRQISDCVWTFYSPAWVFLLSTKEAFGRICFANVPFLGFSKATETSELSFSTLLHSLLDKCCVVGNSLI